MNEASKPDIVILPLAEKARSEGPSEMDFLVRLPVPEIPLAGDRPRLNLGLVLDRSGSMSGSKLTNAKKAAGYCVDQLLPEDLVSMVIFDDRVEVLVPPAPGSERQRIKQALETVRSGGTTALHAAWVAGGRQVAENLDPHSMNRVILLTDGLANVGETDPQVFVSQAEGLFRRGISTTTIGVGHDFHEDLLVAMAKAAGGNSWFVEGPEDFQRIFETEMGGLLREVCTKVSLGLEPAEGVKILDVLNDFDRTGTGKYRLPNLLAGECLDIMVRVLLPGGQPGPAPVFRATLGWAGQGSAERRYAHQEAFIAYVPAAEAATQEQHREVVKIRQLLGSARARRQAMAEMDAGEVAAARQTLGRMVQASLELNQTMQDPELAQDAREIDFILKEMADLADLRAPRKLMAYESLYRQRGRKTSLIKKEQS
ncbi:MAG: vWA domain-containing protein [Desulfobaccales bacterium]